MTKLHTSNSRDFTKKQIKTLLDHHKKSGGKVQFIEEMHWWSPKLKWWTGDTTGALFWQEKIPTTPAGCTNWFGYYWKREYTNDFELIGKPGLFVFGMEKFEPVIDAVYLPETDVLMYSRYQHDFFYDPTGKVAVDGGRDYGRILGDRDSYVCVPYNLMTKTFTLNGVVHEVR